MGQNRLFGSRYRFFRQKSAQRPYNRHDPRQFQNDHGNFLLFFYRSLQICFSDYERRRFHRYSDLYGQRTGFAKLQYLWVLPRPPWKLRFVMPPWIWASRAFGLTLFPPVRLRRLRLPGIGDFRKILHWNELNCPLHRNVTQEEVGMTTMALLSPCGTGITGEVIHVDCGYHIQGMLCLDNAAETAAMLSE